MSSREVGGRVPKSELRHEETRKGREKVSKKSYQPEHVQKLDRRIKRNMSATGRCFAVCSADSRADLILVHLHTDVHEVSGSTITLLEDESL